MRSPVASAAFYGLTGSGEMPMGLAGKGANYPDPYDWLSFCMCVQAYEGTRYAAWYCNPELDQLVEEAEGLAAFPDQRIAKYQQAEQILIEDSPRAFLYHSLKFVAHTPDLKGFYIHLKTDGNFGFNTDDPGPYAYLPVNRWKNKNGVLTLTLDQVVYSFTLPTVATAEETTLTTVDSTWNAFQMTYVTKNKGGR